MRVNLTQAATLIATVGSYNTFMLRGAPGVGKSSILRTLSAAMPDYLPCYIDCSTLDLGDLQMPVVDHETMTTRFAPNIRFGVYPGQTRPVLIMLDELSKTPRSVLNALLPVMLERRMGDVPLPVGSVVFATGNLDTDGVGDQIPAHAYNRMTVLDVDNPTADEWQRWAAANGIAPELVKFAHDFPEVFQRYDDLPKDHTNPYIFDPRRGMVRSFCSPRSLEKASNIIKQRELLGEATLPALIGTVGEAAGRQIESFTALFDKLPRLPQIVADPMGCPLPGDAGACYMMAIHLAGKADAQNGEAIARYVQRWDSGEAKVLFTTSISVQKSKLPQLVRIRAITELFSETGRAL